MKKRIGKYTCYKTLMIFFLVLLYCYTTIGQININLLIAKPPAYLSSWGNPIAGQLLITNNSPSPIQAKLSTQLQDGSGNTIATSNNPTAQLLLINNGASMLKLDRVLQLENMRFAGSSNTLATSGRLATGTYQLCVQLLSIDGKIISNQQCKIFNIANYQLPFLLSPNDKDWLDATISQTAIIFRWSSLVPMIEEGATYRLQVYEVLSNQTTMQALRSNRPILLVDQKLMTQYIWRPQLSFKDSVIRTFIWTVQTFDNEGRPFTSNDETIQGRSEPRVFGICNKRVGTNPVDCGADYHWQ